VHPLNKWSGISITSVPYGQEVAATSMQMLTALNVVANGGNLMKPYLVQSIQDEHDVVIQRNEPVIKRRVITENTARTMGEILTKVVESGTGTAAQIDGVKVAGKTGTSQKILPTGGYSHTNFIGSFLGFAPVEKPLFSMIVVVDDPHPSYYGGTVAAPVFNAVAQEILPYLGYVWPAESENPKKKKKAA
jgi:cell division protein FtsI/penicillin-binding protein 2